MRRIYRLPALAAGAVLLAGSTTAVALAANRTDDSPAVRHVEVEHTAEPGDDTPAPVATTHSPTAVHPVAKPRPRTESRQVEQGDDRGAAVEPGDDNAGAAESGDDRGSAAEPGDDNGGAVEPGDDNGGAVEPADDSGSGHGSDDRSGDDSGHDSGGGSDDGGSHG
jgi:hypothetical protein